jgi:hypothetical protein|tara:strand:+ start:206 stop:394 length:189 start_codon:yes stop_codon:yes gene_type:complete
MPNVELTEQDIAMVVDVLNKAQVSGFTSMQAVLALGAKFQLVLQAQNGQVAPETEEEVKAGR